MAFGRKISGGKYHRFRKKKHYESRGITRKVKLAKVKKKSLRVKGGNIKSVLLSSEFANVMNPKTKKAKKSKILNVIETPSDRFLARQNVLVKSAIIETELGKAKITNRPSQEPTIQAVLIE